MNIPTKSHKIFWKVTTSR